MSYSPSKKKTWNTSDFWACSVESPRPRAVLSTSAVLESLSDFRLCEGGEGGGGGSRLSVPNLLSGVVEVTAQKKL